jgi:hypothetical protein
LLAHALSLAAIATGSQSMRTLRDQGRGFMNSKLLAVDARRWTGHTGGRSLTFRLLICSSFLTRALFGRSAHNQHSHFRGRPCGIRYVCNVAGTLRVP